MFGRWFGRSGADHHYERGIALLHRGEFDSAVESFELSLRERSDPEHPTTALAHFYRAEAQARLGRAALAAGRDDQAVRHLERALQTQPNFPDLSFCLGLAKFRLGDDRGALGAACIALRHNQRYLEAQALSYLCHVGAAESVLAGEALGRCRELAENRSDPLARRLVGQPPPQAAELLPLLLESPRRRERIESAQSLLGQGFWSEAREGFTELVRQHPGYPDLRVNLARAHYGLRDYDSCLAELDAALAIRPDLAEAHALAGIVQLQRNQVAVAKEHFLAGIAANTQSSVLRYGLAVCHLLLDELSECAAIAEKLGIEHPDSEATQRLVCLSRSLGGESENGLRAAQAWSALRDRDPASVVDRIAVALDAGRHDLARRWLAELPDGAASEEIALCRARTLAACGDLRGARELLNASRTVLGPSPALSVELADLHLQLGDSASAVEQLESGAATPSRARLLLARALRQAGRSESAAALLGEPGPASMAERLERLFTERTLGDIAASEDALVSLRSEDPLQLVVRAQDPKPWSRPFVDLLSESKSLVEVRA